MQLFDMGVRHPLCVNVVSLVLSVSVCSSDWYVQLKCPADPAAPKPLGGTSEYLGPTVFFFGVSEPRFLEYAELSSAI